MFFIISNNKKHFENVEKYYLLYLLITNLSTTMIDPQEKLVINARVDYHI